jgi:hypothetical protein
MSRDFFTVLFFALGTTNIVISKRYSTDAVKDRRKQRGFGLFCLGIFLVLIVAKLFGYD